jgi:hypothetical protein
MAIIIQSILRIRIAKTKYYKKLGEKYFYNNLFFYSIIKIQKNYRGYLGRKKFNFMLNNILTNKIDIPAIILIQKIIRNKLAQKKFIYAKYKKKCLLTIQIFIKNLVYKKYQTILKKDQKIKKSAILIQKNFRGCYCRKIFKKIKFVYFYNFKFIPTIIKIQAIYRMHKIKSKFLLFKLQLKSSLKIQNCYKNYKFYLLSKLKLKQLQLNKKIKKITLIQKMIRSFIAKKFYKKKYLQYKSKLIKSSRIIIRAWKNYLYYKNYKNVLHKHRQEISKKKQLKYTNTINELNNDVNEIYGDIEIINKFIKRNKNRVRDLDTFVLGFFYLFLSIIFIIIIIFNLNILLIFSALYSLVFKINRKYN